MGQCNVHLAWIFPWLVKFLPWFDLVQWGSLLQILQNIGLEPQISIMVFYFIVTSWLFPFSRQQMMHFQYQSLKQTFLKTSLFWCDWNLLHLLHLLLQLLRLLMLPIKLTKVPLLPPTFISFSVDYFLFCWICSLHWYCNTVLLD